MSPYTLLVSLHVTVAVLGLGPLMALALLTRRPPLPAGAARPMPPEPALRAFLRLLRLSQISLGVMLVTGVVMVSLVHGAFARQGWMMVSGALFLALGAGTGLTQRWLKQAAAATGAGALLDRAHRVLVLLCVLIAAIAWLMQAKPF